MEEMLYDSYFIQCLTLLNEKIQEKNLEPISIYYIDRFSIIFYGSRMITSNIDSFLGSNRELNELILEVGQEMHNLEWLNDYITMININDISTLNEILSLDDAFEESINMECVKILTATKITILYIKLMNYKNEDLSFDLQDIVSLTSALGNVDDIIHQLIFKFKNINKCINMHDIINNYILSLYSMKVIDNVEYTRLYKEYVINN